MKKRWKVLGMLMSAAVLLPALAGCGGGQGEDTADSPGGEDGVFTIAYAPNESTTESADMAYMGSQAMALGVERTDLEPIVMKAEEGDPEKAIYHSVLITSSANNEINSIEDIKGKTMAFVDPDSTSGNLVPTAEIIQAFPAFRLLYSPYLRSFGLFLRRSGCC